MDFWAYTDQFFSIGLLENFHNEDFSREKFWYGCSWWVTVWKFLILSCLFLIGGGNQVNDQYGPATGMARAFRNGITLDGWPKNKGVRAYLVKLEIFGKKWWKTKSPWKGPLWTFLVDSNGTRWYVWMFLRDSIEKTRCHESGGPDTVVPPN